MKNKTGLHTLEVMNKAAWYNKWLFSAIKPHLKGDILDVGAGTGNFMDYLISSGKVTAIDRNHAYIEKLKQRYKGKIREGMGDIEEGSYFFEKRKFDSIVCLNVMEHTKDDEKVLKNILGLLKVGGKLILLVPAHQLLYSRLDSELGHYRRYGKKSLSMMLKRANLRKVRLRYVNWWGAVGWFIFVKLGRKAMIPEKEVFLFDKLGKFFLFPERHVKLPFGLSLLAVCEK